MPYVFQSIVLDMKKYKVLFVIMLVGLLLSCKSSQNKAPASFFDGTWIGESYQLNVDEDWSMRLDIDSKNKSYIVAYPSLNCGSTCKLIESMPNRLVLYETLEYGLNTCSDKGKIEMVKDSEYECTVFYYYNLWDNAPVAVGKVTRGTNQDR